MPLKALVSHAVLLFVILTVASGCQSQEKTEPETDPVARISMHDRLRLTLADADAVGIHLFDLKKMRTDLMTLKETEPELASALLADLDRVEALPKEDVRARAVIGKEMYARIRKAQ
jgi:predicted component of type VI protein secretion system